MIKELTAAGNGQVFLLGILFNREWQAFVCRDIWLVDFLLSCPIINEMKTVVIILNLVIFLLIPLSADENIMIDWKNGKIYSSVFIRVKNNYNFANNRLAGTESAKNKAKAYFYKALKKINLYESTSVFDYFEERVEKNREFFSLIDKAELYKEEFPDMNTIKFIYHLNIYGENSLMGLMIGERDIFTENLSSYAGFHYDTNYSGVIIDARGELTSFDGYKVNVKPALFVTIKDNDGRLVFNQYNVFPDIIKNNGMVKYSYGINEDYSDRVGSNPLKIVASGVGDKTGSIIVLTVSDAKRMLSSEKTRSAVQQGKVVIIIDP